MVSSIDNGNSGDKALEGRKSWGILGDFRLIGVGVGVLFWFLESAIHAFLFMERTFVQQAIAPHPNELWMRSLIVLLLVGTGFYVQWWTLKRIEEYKSGRPHSLPDNIRRYAIGTAILWTLIVGVSLTWNFFLQYDNPRKGVSVPLDAYTATTGAYAVSLTLGHGLMWLIGVSGIGYGSRRLGRELTRRKQAEEELYESERQHEVELAHAARLSSMGEMASGLAHEINQPLCAIASFADASVRMLESGKLKGKDILETMQSVSAQAHRAGEIVRNMRAFIRKDPAKSSEIDIRKVIGDSVNLVRGQVKQKQAKVKLELPDKFLTARANRVQIEQVIINLIQNSLDAMDQTDIGGRVILISACKTDDEK
ncbi:hypothetical protein LCGC14_2771320, partial [marine sediment metagenome]